MVALPQAKATKKRSDVDADADADARLDGPTIRIHGRHFVDAHGRVVQLRGVNLSGISKVPSSDPSLDIPDPERSTSYVNRPFPLEDAPEHWRRLKRWGLNYCRVTVPWEAVEHEGPGIYDEAYLDYLRKLLESMTEHGLVAYVCLHQDVWSRHCGGSGAPAWTLRSAGFDLGDAYGKMMATGAAYMTGMLSRGKRTPGDRGLWPTGYQKLACATMNTAFWGGKMFAPGWEVEGENIQDWLQARYLAMFERLVGAVGGVEGVLGFELMNEPHHGYIGMQSLHGFNYNTDLHLGTFPSPIQSFALGDGHPTRVDTWVRSFPFPTRRSGKTLVNPDGVQVWRQDLPVTSNGSRCPWAREGVWAWDEEKKAPVVLKEGHFARRPDGTQVDFYEDCYWPFVKRWEAVAKGMRHVEPIPNEFCPAWPVESRPDNLVFSPHWYDLYTMFRKEFGNLTVNVQGLSRGMFIAHALYWGRRGVKRNYARQMATLVDEARKRIGEVPIVIGECGIPMDLNGEQAFSDGDFAWHARMMDALLSALESSMVGFNLWTYSPANEDEIGDDWNNENFSWYGDKHKRRAMARARGAADALGDDGTLDLGAKLLPQIARPYALKTAGIPLSSEYTWETQRWHFRWANRGTGRIAGGPPINTHCEITSDVSVLFLPPSMVVGIARGELEVRVSDGDWEVRGQHLVWRHAAKASGTIHEIEVGREIKRDGGGARWETLLRLLPMLLAVLVVALGKYLGTI